MCRKLKSNLISTFFFRNVGKKILNEAQKKEVKLGVEAQKFEDLKKRILTEKETFFLNIHDEGDKYFNNIM